MAVTRINNNQITDASEGNVLLGINANTKIQNFSITAGKIANNLTYGSDLTVTGNLTVNGQSTAIDTTITTIEDPVIVLASTQTGSPVVDIGFLGERGTSNNIAFVWDESSGEFVTVFTDTSETSTTVNIISYSNFHTNDANIGGNAVINGTTSLVGNLVGAVQATSNVTGGNLLTAGLVSATGTITSGANITGANILTGGTVSATGNISTSNFFIGNGSQLTGVTASSANAETLTGVFLAPNVLASSLTSVGDLTSLSVVGTTQSGNLQTAGLISATGNVTSGNINTAGVASATGNVTGGNIITGGLVSAIGAVRAGSLETSGTANATGTITGGNISTGGFLSAVGTATVGNLNTNGTASAGGNVTGANIITGGTVSATGTVTGGNIATGGTVSATATVTGGNIATGGTVSATGNITGGNVNAPQVYGSGALSLIAGTGNINLQTVGNVVLANTFINGVAYPAQAQDAASKIYVDNLVSTGISYHEEVVATTNTDLATATGGTITYAQPNGAANGVGATLTTTGTFNLIDTANIQSVGTRVLVKNQANAVQNGVYVWSNATVITRAISEDTYGVGNAFLFGLNDYFFTTSGNVNAGAAFIVDAPTGTITFGTSDIQFAQFSSSQVYSANTAAGISLTGTVFSTKVDNNTTAFDGLGNIIVKASANLTTPNIGAATGTSLSTTGTVTGGNIATGGTVSATGTATAGNIATGGTVSATGTVTGGNIATGGTVSATGTATAGNLVTGGTVSATGNVTGANIITGGLITSTGNVTGGNILTGGLVSATGTVTGGNLETGGTASVTGTATVGNIATGGTVSATATVTGGNIATGGTVSATGNILSSGSGSFTGNVTAANFIGNISGNLSAPGSNTDIIFNDNGVANATAGFTFDKTSNAITVIGTITGGNLATAGTTSAGGNITGANVLTGGIVSATSTITGGNIATGGTVSATSTITGGNIATGGAASVTGNITGGNITTAGALQGGNIVISGDDITDTNGRVNINTAGADVDFAVNGDTVANVFYVDAGTGTASFGSSTQTVNAVVAFNATTSILAPVGNTAQRPDGVTGMVRFNTTNNNLELYNNSQWTAVGVPEFTVIENEQFFGDGSTVSFTLGSTQTTNSCIVSINGVVQIPITAYSVSGTDPTCVLTFTEAPAPADAIEVRQITTTTSVTSIANASGNAVISVSDITNDVSVTGDLVPTGNLTQDLGSATRQWRDLYLSGNSIILGNTVIKNTGGNTIGFFGPNGTTPATIDAASVDTTTIANGTSSMAVIATGGNIRANIGGTTVQTISAGLVAITGDLSVTGNATLSGNILGDRIQNGTTQIDIQTPSGNANISIGGTSNVAVFTTTGVVVTGAISATGAVTAASVVGGVITGSSTSVTGAVTAASVVGGIMTGSSLSVTGTVTGASLTGTITTAAQPNITSVGTLSTATITTLSTSAITKTGSNGVGNIGQSDNSFNTIFAKATSAQYADLAEKYTADTEYAPGTVLIFGGSAEVTADAADSDRRVAGVVSTKPAYIMNDGLDAPFVATVALTGRVPCLVTGTVRKGDMMVSAGLGRARAEADPRVGTVIGKALEDHDGVSGTIEVVVGRF